MKKTETLTVLKKTDTLLRETFYVGTDFVNQCKGVLENSELVHLGMGDFKLEVKEYGDIFFWRMNQRLDGLEGRTHRFTDNRDGYLTDKLMSAMNVEIKPLR